MSARPQPYILPISAGSWSACSWSRRKGTHRMAALFGPICGIWFLILGALGLYHLADDPSIFRAFNPWYGLRFLLENGFLGFVILGSVFLAVTGAEALYADMGHFGKKPIQAAWIYLASRAWLLNYLGQGALVLDHPASRHNPFWDMVPPGRSIGRC
jgi:KUP system potassium uptake protein